jgi:PAS domain S-box-containing protein
MTASAIFIYRDERILFVNTTAASVTGYAEDELLTKRMTDIVHPDDRGLIAEKEPSTDESTPRRYECRFVTKSGSVRWMDFTSGWIHFQGLSVRLGTASDMTERKMTEEKLRLLTSEISMTEERERRRMASYLHDVIGQALTLCKLKIRSLQRSTSAETTVKTLQELRELVEQSIANTQSLTFELCPPILYELNLEAAIEWLAEQFSAQHAIEFEVVDDRQQKPVGIESRVILFQAAREVFMNVVKHADAKKVCVSMHRTGSNIRLVVQDDGVGFDVEKKMVTEKPSGGGFGLFNIRERLRSLGGAVNIESSPEHGTTVTISAPLTNGGVAAPRTFGEAKGVVGS